MVKRNQLLQCIYVFHIFLCHSTFMQLLLRIRDSSYAMRKKYCKSKGPDPHLQITSYQVSYP